MLCSVKRIEGFRIFATDGDIGRVEDVRFDDAQWAIRYLVVDIGAPEGRKVLIEPASLRGIDPRARRVAAALTCDEVRAAPPAYTEQPIARDSEVRRHDVYPYPRHWEGGGLSGTTTYPEASVPGGLQAAEEVAEREAGVRVAATRESGDQHLRSSRDAIGYHIEASDGSIGHIDDFLFDEQGRIGYVVVDTRNWLPSQRVLVAPSSIALIDWSGRRARFHGTREELKKSPEYDPSAPPPERPAEGTAAAREGGEGRSWLD